MAQTPYPLRVQRQSVVLFGALISSVKGCKTQSELLVHIVGCFEISTSFLYISLLAHTSIIVECLSGYTKS